MTDQSHPDGTDHRSPATDHQVPGVIAPPPLIFGGGLVLGLVLKRLMPGIPLPRPVRITVGSLLAAGGVSLAGSAIRTMERSHTPVDPGRPVTALVEDGPFRLTRNPGYLGAGAVSAGVALLANALPALLLLPAVLTVIQRGVVEREERYLERRFGDRYLSYQRRVPRWL